MIKPIAQLKTADSFLAYLRDLAVELPFDAELAHGPSAPLAQPYSLPALPDQPAFTLTNRFCIHPMEGWDGTLDGCPTANTRRRWANFGRSGAKLIWGGEATAVMPEARANPNQLMIDEAHLPALRALREELVEAHVQHFGSDEGLLVGLQLTHSGRYSKPDDPVKMKPVILYHHPILDRRLKLPADYPLISDEGIEHLIARMIDAAEMAYSIGYSFVDIKHCHGYLGHEFLSAVTREGKYGGSFENRTRYLREVVAGIRARVPGRRIGVRLSAFDFVPFEPDPETGVGRPSMLEGAPFRFGGAAHDPLAIDLSETLRFVALLEELGVSMLNVSAGSPYYNPHIQRPALFPPSDGYKPPEDPLIGVARQVQATAAIKAAAPGMLVVGSGYSYLQEWLPNVAQAVVRSGMADFVGLGRLVLSYPAFCADVLDGKPLERKLICRTFSDCTTAPRKGLVSGCYPLDPYYKDSPQAEALLAAKKTVLKPR